MVGVIVTASMHHQAATRHILTGETRREHRVGGRPVGRNIERGQITQMTVSPRQPVVARSLRVVVRSGGLARHHRAVLLGGRDRKSTRLNSSHSQISYAVFCLKKKKKMYTSILCYS